MRMILKELRIIIKGLKRGNTKEREVKGRNRKEIKGKEKKGKR